MKHVDLVVCAIFLCSAPWITESARSFRRVHHAVSPHISRSRYHDVHQVVGSNVENASKPVMMNHAKFYATSQHSGLAKPITFYDESLEHTFRQDDFVEGSTWKSQPRINTCRNVRSLPERQAHRCDFLEMQMFVATETSTTERFYAREFVAPYPNEDQIKRLREGPFQDLAQQDKLQRVTFVVHGYMGGGANTIGVWEERIGKELAEGGLGADAAIVIEWTRGAHASWEDCHGFECLDDYAVAMADARVVGKYIQRLAAGVREVAGSVQFGCIGHSVGSHVCGFASKYMALEDLPHGKLHMSRISGLDPAGPSHSLVVDVHAWLGGRSFVDPSYRHARLDKSDADFVDIYISDPGGFGYDMTLAVKKQAREQVLESDMLGHATFLINGRHYAEHKDFQPGCEDNTFKVGCSHHVAIDLYLDSVVARKQLLKKHHANDNPIRKSFERFFEAHPELHPKTASHTASIIIVCVLLGVILVCGGILYWYIRTLLFYLKVILILVMATCAIVAVVWLFHRHAPSKQRAVLSQETSSVMIENLEQDYCEGLAMEHMLARCEFPFSTYEGHSGSTCPKFKDEKVTFGICAGPSSPTGLYLAPVKADADD